MCTEYSVLASTQLAWHGDKSFMFFVVLCQLVFGHEGERRGAQRGHNMLMFVMQDKAMIFCIAVFAGYE